MLRGLLSALLSCCVVAATSSECVAENAASAPSGVAKENFHIYVLLGQSNMAGRGKMTAMDRQPVDGVYMLDANNKWQLAAHPLHFDKPSITGVGLGINFAQTILDIAPHATIGLIPCAVGGTRLDQWSRGGKLYNASLARARLGQQVGELKGVLWHQGESDSTDKLAPTYGTRLAQFIDDFRRDLEQPALPFVVGELGHFRRDAHPQTDEINRQLHALPSALPRVAVASAAGLEDQGDKTHFDADSLKTFGRRYAEAIIESTSSGHSGSIND
ncbi:hypothetical protein PLANPX_2414 [Lacipirellula parvula]|uniref:Sialate O-acetylesterase domain-containing protein n=2 Tax=Lacipirellula parvula TaxID=2650471 RepID=A0A5K7XA79_9BACT|nr:hypothetical protein PLANPX_2414 [Lacipirellula parvula]